MFKSFEFNAHGPHSADHCRDLNFVYHIVGKALKGHLIRNISTPNCELCQIECFMERRCVSYNCRGELNSCELNSADHIDHPEDLEDEEGSDYHAAEVCSLGYLFLQFQEILLQLLCHNLIICSYTTTNN